MTPWLVRLAVEVARRLAWNATPDAAKFSRVDVTLSPLLREKFSCVPSMLMIAVGNVLSPVSELAACTRVPSRIRQGLFTTLGFSWIVPLVLTRPRTGGR